MHDKVSQASDKLYITTSINCSVNKNNTEFGDFYLIAGIFSSCDMLNNRLDHLTTMKQFLVWKENVRCVKSEPGK